MKKGSLKLILMALGAALLCALWWSPALAQCAMCKAAVTGASGGALGRNLNMGILVLLVPPVTIFCAIFIAAYRYRTAPGETLCKNHEGKKKSERGVWPVKPHASAGKKDARGDGLRHGGDLVSEQ